MSCSSLARGIWCFTLHSNETHSFEFEPTLKLWHPIHHPISWQRNRYISLSPQASLSLRGGRPSDGKTKVVLLHHCDFLIPRWCRICAASDASGAVSGQHFLTNLWDTLRSNPRSCQEPEHGEDSANSPFLQHPWPCQFGEAGTWSHPTRSKLSQISPNTWETPNGCIHWSEWLCWLWSMISSQMKNFLKYTIPHL